MLKLDRRKGLPKKLYCLRKKKQNNEKPIRCGEEVEK